METGGDRNEGAAQGEEHRLRPGACVHIPALVLTSPEALDKSLPVLIPQMGVTTVPVSRYVPCSYPVATTTQKTQKNQHIVFKTMVCQGSGYKSTAFLPPTIRKEI